MSVTDITILPLMTVQGTLTGEDTLPSVAERLARVEWDFAGMVTPMWLLVPAVEATFMSIKLNPKPGGFVICKTVYPVGIRNVGDFYEEVIRKVADASKVTEMVYASEVWYVGASTWTHHRRPGMSLEETRRAMGVDLSVVKGIEEAVQLTHERFGEPAEHRIAHIKTDATGARTLGEFGSYGRDLGEDIVAFLRSKNAFGPVKYIPADA
jgi:hypothetical protein